MKAMPLESFGAVAGVLEVWLNPPHAASQTVRMRVRGGGAWTLQPPIPGRGVARRFMPAVGKAATKVKIQKIVYTQPLLKLRLSLFERVFRKGDKMYNR
jgi:hypothetical protein